jgi:hypothetical protein
MTNNDCWICGATANSREHVFKSRDLKRIFDRDGLEFKDLPTHIGEVGHSKIPGPKSDIMKYQPSLCSDCNNTRTAKSDRAYDLLSDWIATSQGDGGVGLLRLDDVFGENFLDEIDYLRRYFAKSLGCRIAASNSVVFPDDFPNPVTGANLDKLCISICRTQPMRSLPGYTPELFQTFLAKGDLIATYSRSHLELTGRRKISRAIWSETIGHFQINHWFNISTDPRLGDVLDGSSNSYHIVENDFDLPEMKDAMWAWLNEKLSE